MKQFITQKLLIIFNSGFQGSMMNHMLTDRNTLLLENVFFSFCVRLLSVMSLIYLATTIAQSETSTASQTLPKAFVKKLQT